MEFHMVLRIKRKIEVYSRKGKSGNALKYLVISFMIKIQIQVKI